MKLRMRNVRNVGRRDVRKNVTSCSNVLHDGEQSPPTRAPAKLALSRRCACRRARNVSL